MASSRAQMLRIIDPSGVKGLGLLLWIMRGEMVK